jgi:ADP-dependent phosphofructokinase/glucokinase
MNEFNDVVVEETEVTEVKTKGNSYDKKSIAIGAGLGALVYAGISWLVKKIFKLDEKNVTKHINENNKKDVKKKLDELDKQVKKEKKEEN